MMGKEVAGEKRSVAVGLKETEGKKEVLSCSANKKWVRVGFVACYSLL